MTKADGRGTDLAALGGMARRKPSLVDDLVLLPWWVSAGLALAAFLVLSAALPRSMAGLAPMIAVFLMLIAGISALRTWKTARMLEQQTGIDSIRELPWKRFEDLLGEAYRRQGYQVLETLGASADGGVDLVLRKDGAVTLVQCKRWKGKPVPVQTVRELFGVPARSRRGLGEVGGDDQIHTGCDCLRQG